MALSINTQWEIQTGGNDTNGGGFVAGAAGTNYSLVPGKRVATGTDDSTTDAVAAATSVLTSATANFQPSIVGNIIYLQGGTGALANGWYQVVSRTNATTIGLDRVVPAGTGITMNIGGAIATPGGMGRIGATVVNHIIDNTIWIKAGTYLQTLATVNVPNGSFSFTQRIHIEGYNTVRGDLGTPPFIQASGAITGFTMFNAPGISTVWNLSLDCASKASSTGLTIRGHAYKILVQNATNNGIVTSTSGTLQFCTALNCLPSFTLAVGSELYACVAGGGASIGFVSSGNVSFSNCISYGHTGATGYGFEGIGESQLFTNCVAYGNSKDGFRNNSDPASTYINCVAEGNAEFGFRTITNSKYINCAGFNNTLGNVSIGPDVRARNISFITGTATFFTSPGTQNFSLNNTAGGGALLRETGIPGLFLGISTTGYLDVGAVQHQGGGGGGESSAVF